MFLLMYLACNRFRRTMIHLYAFLDALLHVLKESERSSLLQKEASSHYRKLD